MRKKSKMVCIVGINDADYVVSHCVNGKHAICPFYATWVNMLARCYSAKIQAAHPTYIGCSAVTEWHSFMSFRAWMEQQDWEGKQLDKDLLIAGNKVYSPDTCVFVSRKLNTFTTDSGATRGQWPIGVNWQGEAFRAMCSNPFSGKKEHLGCFTCPHEAHEAWRARKHELALIYADQQTDHRIAAALRTRYAPGAYQVAA